MFLAKISKLRIFHTADILIAVAELFSRHFPKNYSHTCQLKLKTRPPHIEFSQLQPDNFLNHIHFELNIKDNFPTKKLIHTSYLLTMVMTNSLSELKKSGIDVTYTPLASFSFLSITPIKTKYEKLVKSPIRTLPQKNPFLIETDLYIDNDPI